MEKAEAVTTVKVVTAVLLSKEIEEKLEETLSDLIGGAISLEKSVDPALLGGIVVKTGDRIIDGSLRGRLNRLREEIAMKIKTA